jgi:hypothetical protein
MRNVLLMFAASLAMQACSKSDVINAKDSSPSTLITALVPKYPATAVENPILGKWYIGKFERHCGDQIMAYENNNGNYVEFKANDSVYYTFVTDGSFGLDSYKVIDDSTIIMNGIAQKIISLDTKHFTVYYEETDGYIKQWMTFLR